MKRTGLAYALVLYFGAKTALACGGADVADVALVVSPPENAVASVMLGDGYWVTGDQAPYRFLDPFELAGGRCDAALSALAYDSKLGNVQSFVVSQKGLLIDSAAFDAAVRKSDVRTAKREAQKLVDRVLDQAAPMAALNADVLELGARFLDLAAALAGKDDALLIGISQGTEPPPELANRAQLARNELEALTRRARAEIGSGWPGQTGTDERTWASLLAGFDGWLARYKRHPLADMARLRKLRVLYLKGDQRGAWDLLLELYHRRPCRAVWEMRHLLQQGWNPEHWNLARLDDLPLAAALLRASMTISPDTWNALWRRSDKAAPGALRNNMQERLLAKALQLAQSGALPADFPSSPSKPSERWAQFRTAALLSAKQQNEAAEQAALLDTDHDPVSARLAAQAFGSVGDWARAAQGKALNQDAARYLLDILADDGALEQIVQAATPRSAQAALALATRRLASDGWESGARILAKADPVRAALWSEAARRASASDASSRLELARWLRSSRGAKLFLDQASRTSRGLKYRLDYLRQIGLGESTEASRLEQYLLTAGPRERALAAYADALTELSPKSRAARAALEGADQVYNSLLNWDFAGEGRYAELLRSSPAAQAIREAGKKIRAAQ